MDSGDRLSRESALDDQTAELRFRAVVAAYDEEFEWPPDDSIPDVVRADMEPDVQAYARMHIERAFQQTVDRWKNTVIGPAPVLNRAAGSWLAAPSTVPHGRGATNLARVREAIEAADRGNFCPGEFRDLWQSLRDHAHED